MKAFKTGRGAGHSDAKFAFQFGSPSAERITTGNSISFRRSRKVGPAASWRSIINLEGLSTATHSDDGNGTPIPALAARGLYWAVSSSLLDANWASPYETATTAATTATAT